MQWLGFSTSPHLPAVKVVFPLPSPCQTQGWSSYPPTPPKKAQGLVENRQRNLVGRLELGMAKRSTVHGRFVPGRPILDVTVIILSPAGEDQH